MNKSDLKDLIRESLLEVLAEVNYDTTKDGKPVIAIGAPGSQKRTIAISDPTKEEMIKVLHNQFGREEGFEDSAEAAIYWFANFNHGGQWTNLYSVLSTSPFDPGPIARGPAPDSMESDMLQALEYEFGGQRHNHGTEGPHPGEEGVDDVMQEDGAAGGGTGMGMSVTGAVQGYSTPHAFKKKKIKEDEQPEPYDAESDQLAPGPRSRTSDVSVQDKFNAEIEQLKKQYPNISFGYIGNVWNEPGMPKDDLSWYVFNRGKKFGGYATQDLPLMWDKWQKEKEKFLGGQGAIKEAPSQNFITHYAVSGLEQIPDSTHASKKEALLAAAEFLKGFVTQKSKAAGEKLVKIDNGYAIKHIAGGTVAIATVKPQTIHHGPSSLAEAPQNETMFERLDQALTAVEEYVVKNRIQVDSSEHEPNEVDPYGIREPFLYGGISYGQTKQADYKLLVYKGQRTRKYMHVVIHRTEQGRYELNVYTL